MKINDYYIIHETNWIDMQEAVKNFMNSHDGYELCGGVSVVLEEAGCPGINRYIKPCFY